MADSIVQYSASCVIGSHSACAGCRCACHGKQVIEKVFDSATYRMWQREAYLKGAKDERKRAEGVQNDGHEDTCSRCKKCIPFPHASGLCKLCEVESRAT